MQFYKIKEIAGKNGVLEIYPDFNIGDAKDFMVRGGKFYAIWDDINNIWSRNETTVSSVIDYHLNEAYEKRKGTFDGIIKVKYMSDFSSGKWEVYKRFVSKSPDNFVQLDSKVTFKSDTIVRKDYVSKRLPYDITEGSIESYNRLMNVLYSPLERQKIEWAIGSIFAGDSRKIQKFIVLYGAGGTGKSTVINIIEKLFTGYTTIFNAKDLTSRNNQFVSGGMFADDPLVCYQHDGDLSHIADNSKLNSIVSHELMEVNEKFKNQYTARCNAFLFLGSNKPVKITDAKSGIIRRLIDVTPTGNLIPEHEYDILYSKIDFEIGAIANHCLNIYKSLGVKYYDKYRPMDMFDKTNFMFNFLNDNFDAFNNADGILLTTAYKIYTNYCNEINSKYMLDRQEFREELKNYYNKYQRETRTENLGHVRDYYSEFKKELFYREQKYVAKTTEPAPISLSLDATESLLDKEYANCLAQYASSKEKPIEKWENVTTRLSDLNTRKTHYVRPPENHIVIDFDLKDEKGEKSYEKNIEAASKFPATYTETSKSGAGIHLHYIYDGDVDCLSRIYDEDIEIKVFTGNSSLRRKLGKCNNIPIAHIKDGLPLRGEKKVFNSEALTNEKALRTFILRSLNKEYHAATKPSCDFIYDTLEKAYNSGARYDVSDMRNKVYDFATNSTHQSDYCIKLVDKMKFKSEEPIEEIDISSEDDMPIVFYDVEVFPNLFVVCWKKIGEENKVVKMINPSPSQIEQLLKFKLVGFNCREYDNHILHGRIIGYSNESLYNLSQALINTEKGKQKPTFREAWNYSYTDIYDYSVKKQSLKKWEIELGIDHIENEYPWDQPVPKDKWEEIADYCCNDVKASEAVWNATAGDFKARCILAELAGMSVNSKTQALASKIIFGNDKHPKLKYTNLKTGEQW